MFLLSAREMSTPPRFPHSWRKCPKDKGGAASGHNLGNREISPHHPLRQLIRYVDIIGNLSKRRDSRVAATPHI